MGLVETVFLLKPNPFVMIIAWWSCRTGQGLFFFVFEDCVLTEHVSLGGLSVDVFEALHSLS